MTLRVIIADDESLLRKELRELIQGFSALELVAECENGITTLEAIHTLKPDVVFLDIMMPGIDGLKLVEHIQPEVMPKLVYITAFNQFAVNAFEVEAIDYLLKPISETRFEKTIDRLLAAMPIRPETVSESVLYQSQVRSSDQAMTTVQTGSQASQMHRQSKTLPNPVSKTLVLDQKVPKTEVKLEDIAWVDAAGDYMCIHANQKTHILHSTMKALFKRLGQDQFCRIHRSTIVNKSYISKAYPQSKGDYLVELVDGTQLRLSRTYQAVLADIL
ncbi:response regulator [Marinomonas sp. MED121]|uniref:LytR/AlgR family response regulator transcription factor n=1 Tax=Marinomonas sp. MED121 TaxID=314277 RepID=UPI000068FB7B|nr:LytTR family DNA-binding domain-containing protein [Marinomonas sp. MED121]EAQ65100.1 response regulator [Marinomonas sp. MED121]